MWEDLAILDPVSRPGGSGENPVESLARRVVLAVRDFTPGLPAVRLTEMLVL